MKVDILYLAKGRDEFTRESFHALIENTNWDLVSNFVCFTDGATVPDGLSFRIVNQLRYGGPVAIMLEWLRQTGEEIFAKIDNDVIVPPCWLDQAVEVMGNDPFLGLLGLEPPESMTPNPDHPNKEQSWDEYRGRLASWETARSWHPTAVLTDAIGGVGLMRRSAFAGRTAMLPHGPNGVGGFTTWQLKNKPVKKGWIAPSLKLFLLDRLPFEPWLSLSRQYISEGLQRPWTNYPAQASELWGWWLKDFAVRNQERRTLTKDT